MEYPPSPTVAIAPADLETAVVSDRQELMEKFMRRARPLPRLKPRFGFPTALIALLAFVVVVSAFLLWK